MFPTLRCENRGTMVPHGTTTLPVITHQLNSHQNYKQNTIANNVNIRSLKNCPYGVRDIIKKYMQTQKKKFANMCVLQKHMLQLMELDIIFPGVSLKVLNS